MKKVFVCLLLAAGCCQFANASITMNGYNAPGSPGLITPTTDVAISTMYNSTANLDITSNSQLQAGSLAIGYCDKSTGYVRINTNGEFTVNGDMVIGKFGYGKVDIKTGGKLYTNNTTMESPLSMSWAIMAVDGNSSLWSNGGDLLMGNGGVRYSDLTISNLGTVLIGGDMDTGGDRSYITINNGTLAVGGNLNFADATLNLTDALISAWSINAYDYNPSDTTTTQLTMNSSGIGKINAESLLSADGTLKIAFADGFDPAATGVFDVMDWLTLDGTFDEVVLPELTFPGLSWDTSDLYTTGTIKIVPEPATIIALSVGLIFVRKRKKTAE
ncbi:MAG: PEP-CTERM sorting domain-containing protein [Anaerohalosphaeraceae bacterium]|nr:PEP-CTERM sorting domain-containing protein [Anaerohalosphaeraceae bacterium]